MKGILLLFMFLTHSAIGAEIAITFDDSPTPATGAMSGKERTERLLAQLETANAPPALFFVTAKHIDEQSQARLHQYAAAGHYLGNHSFAHESANTMESDAFLLDAYKAHLTLKNFPSLVPFYRFPYLHYGADAKTRGRIQDGLAELGYRIGYVTVDNFEWYINARYLQALEQGEQVDMEKLGALYVDVLWQTIQFYDKIAQETLGHSPKHVLLLHENDLAALFVGRLLEHIRAQGWTIISPLDAYSDPIASADGDLSFTKQGRVAALAHASGMNTEALRHVSENTEYIDQLFVSYGVLEPRKYAEAKFERVLRFFKETFGGQG